MLNQLRNDRPSDANYVVCPATVVAGDAVLIGGLPAVALESYDASGGGATFRFSGVYSLTVIGATVVSPITGSAVKPGDKLYVTGTLDATTNVTTGLTVSKASGGTLFGSYAGTGITSASTDTAAPVRLKGSV